jgi:hypothetical protein
MSRRKISIEILQPIAVLLAGLVSCCLILLGRAGPFGLRLRVKSM